MTTLIAVGVGLVVLGTGGLALYKWLSSNSPKEGEPLALGRSTALKATDAYYILMAQLTSNGHQEAADKLRIEIMPCVLDMGCQHQPDTDQTEAEIKKLMPEGNKVTV